ncbi:LysM peptidoglycan-binding domain-containing protein [Alicyclobacillus mali]|uniref:LysM peptidoglycan-binding domain-containing protein n=1 Tax=Alicyclobacillus mali (ex Roth et al. 2021) TaxID=1123961 RepID=A0ABS0F2G1_9BACL|nr:lytic transglycosylase domain-containing protein [Alicyclobacillus mali (ex Roth et al. 2021)]MBF8377475.1 LysM peptidoglycan-binding domain-containing protein [Alicyclobacillus mali (ex Roth et al. 2021)]MCL6489396.1 LysM peptidoglycan-binding domain-containing protein [Alicyclobacillus mali (ex Roth et al. 2021)]
MFRCRWQAFMASALAFIAAVGLWTGDRANRAPAAMAPVVDARTAPERSSLPTLLPRVEWAVLRAHSGEPSRTEVLDIRLTHSPQAASIAQIAMRARSAIGARAARPTMRAMTVCVRKGQCLWSIAEAHHTTVGNVMRYNRLHSTVLRVGQVLRLPPSARPTAALPKSPEASSSPLLPSLTYTVQPGDSLWEISNIFGVSISAICSANHLTQTAIYPGERLVIEPSSAFGGWQAQSVLLREAPSWLIPVYKAAGAKYDIPWTVLAAIHKVETDFSTNGDIESYAGAIGPMQFMPSTFAIFGVPAPGHTTPDIHNVEDAIYSAANMLHQEGFSTDPYYAIWTYNHSATYVEDVLHLAVT